MAEGQPERTGLLPELRQMLEELDKGDPVDIFSITPVDERVASEVRLRDLWGEPEPVERIEELGYSSDGHAIRARLYRAAGAEGTILFIHGGGWVLGSLDTHDGSARALANRTPANLLSIEYRKGPEHPFPAAVTDVIAGLDWLLSEGPRLGLDTTRIVLCGESAGGTLAAVLARYARDRGVVLAGQALVYPPTDPSMSTASYRSFATGYYLAADAMAWFYGHYLPDAQKAHPDAALLVAEDLSCLPPTMLVTAGFDPLRDEGRAYAMKLIEAGNDVTYHEVRGGVHGLWVMNAITPATEALIAEVAGWIRGRWA